MMGLRRDVFLRRGTRALGDTRFALRDFFIPIS